MSKALRKAREMTSLAFSPSTDATTPSQRATRLIGQARSALGEATLAVSDRLLGSCVPYRGKQEDRLHDHPRHRGEARQPLGPWVVLSPLLRIGVMFPFLQSPGISPNCHGFSNMMESGSCKASPPLGPSHTWTRKLSSTGSRNLLDCLPPAVPLSQRIYTRVVEIPHQDESPQA